MSSEESFNAATEFHCRRLISLWSKSDVSRRALKERGPALVVQAAAAAAAAPATTTRNKSGYYAVQDDPESKNYTIPAPAPAVRFHYNAKKRTYMENTKAATTCAEQEQQQDHQSSTITTAKETRGRTRRRTLSPYYPLNEKQRKERASPCSPEMSYGSRNCKTSSKRLTDEQKQNRIRLVAADVTVVSIASSAPAAPVVLLPDNFDLDSCFTDESMKDDQWSVLSKVNLDEFDSSLLW